MSASGISRRRDELLAEEAVYGALVVVELSG
jgi:hypothetical protein